jgi:hypothetical protein
MGAENQAKARSKFGNTALLQCPPFSPSFGLAMLGIRQHRVLTKKSNGFIILFLTAACSFILCRFSPVEFQVSVTSDVITLNGYL